jgi:hypothetical protein
MSTDLGSRPRTSWFALLPVALLAAFLAAGCGECEKCGCRLNVAGTAKDRGTNEGAGTDRSPGTTEFVSFDSPDGEWGTVKGEVVWQGKDVPEPAEIAVNVDAAHCLSKGKLHDEKWVINKSNKGVRWVVVWLTPEGSGAIPVHPSLAKLDKNEVTLDQPCCQFAPRVIAMRQGQSLLAKNSAPVTHNVKWNGGKNNGEGNLLIPSGGEAKIGVMKASNSPVALECNIHSWMKAWVRVFDHPYFDVTDENGKFTIKQAPAGKFRLVVWHEDAGWGPGGKQGQPITIKANGETDAGKIEIKPAD